MEKNNNDFEDIKKRIKEKHNYLNSHIKFFDLDPGYNSFLFGVNADLNGLPDENKKGEYYFKRVEAYFDKRIAELKQDKENKDEKGETFSNDNDTPMTKEVSLEEFRNTGLPMYINQILHIFGYAIGFEIDDETKKPTKMIPLRVKFRGFDENTIERNYEKLARYMKENSKELYDEAKYDKK